MLEGLREGYPGTINAVRFGREGKGRELGGHNSLPFHHFEAARPNRPWLALEIVDGRPEDWPAPALDRYGDAIASPARWAARSAREYGPDMIFLTLNSIEQGAGPAEIAARVAATVQAVDIPVAVYGSGDKDRDVPVLTAVAQACQGTSILLGPVTRDAHREVAEAARDCGHAVIAQSPMDVNLAKDLNIRLTKLLPADRIVIDPLTSSLGYGLEYSYSTMERIRLAAIVHDDRMLQMPVIGRVGKEVWKTKEAIQDATRGVWWEAFTAATLLLAGADLVTLRHPDSLALVETTLH